MSREVLATIRREHAPGLAIEYEIATDVGIDGESTIVTIDYVVRVDGRCNDSDCGAFFYRDELDTLITALEKAREKLEAE